MQRFALDLLVQANDQHAAGGAAAARWMLLLDRLGSTDGSPASSVPLCLSPELG